jgi:hypothetical protein
MKWLFKIEDVFDITGRGCIIVPGIPYALGLKLPVGTALTVQTPSGESLQVSIASFEHFHRRAEGLTHAAFAVGGGVTKAQLPIGSDVYLSSPHVDNVHLGQR